MTPLRPQGWWKMALTQAEERKRRTYPEFGRQRRYRLVVLAVEVGGRWSTATQQFLRALARGRALASPSQSRAALAHALQRRWSQMLTVAANTALSCRPRPSPAPGRSRRCWPRSLPMPAGTSEPAPACPFHPAWSCSPKKNLTRKFSKQ